MVRDAPIHVLGLGRGSRIDEQLHHVGVPGCTPVVTLPDRYLLFSSSLWVQVLKRPPSLKLSVTKFMHLEKETV